MGIGATFSSSSNLKRLIGAVVLGLACDPLSAQTIPDASCAAIEGKVPPDCIPPNRDVTVVVPPGANTEYDHGTVTYPEGFALSIDGVAVDGDKRLADRVRQTDLALSKADIQVTFDGLSVSPRLDLETEGEKRTFGPGETVTFQSATNYPAFLVRGEVRIVDLGARGGPRTVSVVPIAPNGTTRIALPQGEDLAAIHRVYDAQGRYNETLPLRLGHRDDRGLVDGVEDGSDSTTRSAIPVAGGSVTVFGKGIPGGAVVRTLDETVRPAPGGDFVIQRILPVGRHSVEVEVTGAGAPLDLTRVIDIPKAEWFGVGVADLTFGLRDRDGRHETFSTGRLGFYIKGKTASGINLTGSADTGEGDLDTIFRDLTKKDPRKLILRINPDDYYPVFGDDSTFEEDAPTSGKFYLKLEKEGNYLLWGNFHNRFGNTEYLRNERTLYGLQGHWATSRQTSKGEPRAKLDFFGASPDNLPQRDVFLGTGGSVYFLQRQDISIGSEQVFVEVRDSVSNRVVSRRALTYGRDYDINYIQGVVQLRQPLTGTTGGGVVSGGTSNVNLVVQYEWTPGDLNVDGMSFGGRSETWLRDNLRLGVTGQVDTTATADQRAYGADLRWELSDDTWATLEWAHSSGPGFASSYSTNGGLDITNGGVVAGTGDALKFEGRAALADLGLAARGYVQGYFENRDGGFSSIDYQVAQDERLWGVYGEVEPTDNLRLSFNYDDYDSTSGRRESKGGGELEYRVSSRVALTFGLLYDKKAGMTDKGERLDAAVKATFTRSDALKWWVFGQQTLEHRGLGRNDRLGIGLDAKLGSGWSFTGEFSGGSQGPGGKALVTKEFASNESAYFGYELDPERDLAGLTLVGKDRGKFVLGGRRQLSTTVTGWGENTYDLFGQRRSLTSTYGIEYTPDSHLSFTGLIEIGQVTDGATGNYDRTGVSFSTRYQDGERLAVSGRIEVRQDRGSSGTTSLDSDTLVLKGTAVWRPNESERLSFNLESAVTNSDRTGLRDGQLVDASIGYALRPVANDRLNLLFKYRFLYDMYGQVIDGTSNPGPRQKSHVISVDAEYDVNRFWTVGGKLGVRLSDTSFSPSQPFERNDAWLAVVNGRYHIVQKWDALVELRLFNEVQARTAQTGALAALYRQIGDNLELGVGVNFGRFSDDLTDLTQDDRGLFINVIGKF